MCEDRERLEELMELARRYPESAVAEITRLRARVAELEARERRLCDALIETGGTLGFLRSIIDSGERWTMTAGTRYRETKDKIRAELDAIKGGGDDG